MKRAQKVEPSLQQPQHKESPQKRSKKLMFPRKKGMALSIQKKDSWSQTLWDKAPLKPHKQVKQPSIFHTILSLRTNTKV
jgi:hypothetical protein